MSKHRRHHGTSSAITQASCEVTLNEATQFASFDVGVELYHGTSLDPNTWAGDGPPTITDAFIDDVVLDTERVGCF